MKKRLGFFVILALLVGGGALVMMGEKSKGKVGLDAVLQVATDAQRDVDRIGFGLTRVSDAEEMKLGDEIAGRAGSWWGSAPPAELASYVDNLGQTLAAHVRRPGIKYTFHVVDSPDINAFALPGGQIFVLRGLINFAESESELAMIVGHEIAHVDLRHCIELFQHELMVKKIAGTSPHDLLSGVRFVLVKSLGTMGVLVHRIVTQGYRQFQEFDADAQGWALATTAGYDPEAGLRIMARMSDRFAAIEKEPREAKSPASEIARVIVSAPGSYLRSHPPTAERIKAFRKVLNDQQSRLASQTFYVGRENLKKRQTRRQLALADETRVWQ